MKTSETKNDETAPARNDTDPAAQVAADLRARLRAMAAPELVELAAQLLTTYVVEGVLPLARAGEGADLAQDAGGEESFAQMLKRLKAGKRDAVLEKFLIDGENISVRIDGYGTLPLTDYRRPNAPPAAPGAAPAAPQPRRESVPGASTSIYNRALYQPDQAPTAPPGQAPARGAPRPPPAAQATPPAATSPAQPGQKKDEGQKNDRFALIELD